MSRGRRGARRGKGGGRGRGRKGRGSSPRKMSSSARKKGVLAAIRLALVVIVLTGMVAVGVNLSLLDTGEVDRLRDPSAVWSGERERVEVYNAGGVSGMAREATGVLRDAGFDLVTFGNAAVFDSLRPSEVVDRVGRADMAQAVAATLGIDNVQSEPDPNLYVDVTVVLGRKWSAPTGETLSVPEAEPGWWDPRTWF